MNNAREAAYSIWIIVIGCIFSTILSVSPLQAATPADPEVVPCVPINTAGLITISRCEPENGQPYIINTMGFMMFEQ